MCVCVECLVILIKLYLYMIPAKVMCDISQFIIICGDNWIRPQCVKNILKIRLRRFRITKRMIFRQKNKNLYDFQNDI